MRVSDFLGRGRDHAVGLRELVVLTGLREREVRRLIQQERRRGTVIISDNESGYYLPADVGEIKRFARSMRHRSSEILRVADLADQEAEKYEG